MVLQLYVSDYPLFRATQFDSAVFTRLKGTYRAALIIRPIGWSSLESLNNIYGRATHGLRPRDFLIVDFHESSKTRCTIPTYRNTSVIISRDI